LIQREARIVPRAKSTAAGRHALAAVKNILLGIATDRGLADFQDRCEARVFLRVDVVIFREFLALDAVHTDDAHASEGRDWLLCVIAKRQPATTSDVSSLRANWH
jgi:hypothetical protein